MKATAEIMRTFDALANERRAAILGAKDALVIEGTRYYVANDGDDAADGLTPETAWKTLAKVSAAELKPGDGVFFRRGDLFRGAVQVCAGVAYGAYGEGDKPKLYGWDEPLDDPARWELVDEEHHIWRWNGKTLDPGTLVFGDDETWCRKLIPSYINGKFVCRNDESRDFVMADEMTQDLDLYWHFDSILTTRPSKGQDFPIPEIGPQSLGDIYLRCDKGNPAEVYKKIEAVTRRAMFTVGSKPNVRIDNICIKYVGLHGIAAGGHVKGLHVTNCEIGWIGGTIQHYFGTDPNYPQGGRGTVTRFGNGIEIYGGCEDYLVENCWLYQAYDAGITHQVTTGGKKVSMSNIRYLDNLVENCVYGIEYFLDMTEGDTESLMRDIVMRGNIIRTAGYGWGQQRHNTDTPALIKGWSYVNNAEDYHILDNVFDRAAYRMLHLVCEKQKSAPEMAGNTYIQHLGGMIGQYGGKENGEPPILRFDEQAEETIKTVLGDKTAKVYTIEE